MTEQAQQGSAAPADLSRAAELLREVIHLVDEGTLEATSPQRAHLLGALRVVELLAAR